MVVIFCLFIIYVLAITETWLGTTHDDVCLAELLPKGYGIEHIPRPFNDDKNYGGVTVIYKEPISMTIKESNAIICTHTSNIWSAIWQ